VLADGAPARDGGPGWGASPNVWTAPAQSAWTSAPPTRDDVEPLTSDLRRLHVTVSREFLLELEKARDGLSHAIPNATTEQVLQAALRLLLEKQARARGLVKRPRAVARMTTDPRR
jgi:hypothetical protein